MDDLTETDCLIDDFYKAFEPQLKARLLTDGKPHRSRKCTVSMPELMTLVGLFHQIRYRQSKPFYLNHVCQHLRAEFPRFPSYQRGVEWLPPLRDSAGDSIRSADGQVLRSVDCRFDSPHCLRKPTDFVAPGVPGDGGARQEFYRLVFRIQTSSGHQSLG